MKEQRQVVFQRLQEDSVLLNMLADNRPFWNQDAEPRAMYSIIPADKIYDGIKTPFVTVQMSNDDLTGVNVSDAIFYIRCYNDSDKTFISIDDVLSRVKALLHNHLFKDFADEQVVTDTIYEGTLAELTDEAYDLNFRESQYRIRYL